MRTLVIGGTGNIGSYLVPRLILSGHDVTVIARNPSPQHADPRVAWSQVKWVVADRTAEERDGSWARRMAAIETDVVIDLIAYTPERFRKELMKLSPQKAKKHWRDDPILMKFLSSL